MRRYLVFEESSETLGGVRLGVDNILNDVRFTDYELDKFDMVFSRGSCYPYKFIIIMKLKTANDVKNI